MTLRSAFGKFGVAAGGGVVVPANMTGDTQSDAPGGMRLFTFTSSGTLNNGG